MLVRDGNIISDVHKFDIIATRVQIRYQYIIGEDAISAANTRLQCLNDL